MFLVDPKVFRFVVKGIKAIFLGVQRVWGLGSPLEEQFCVFKIFKMSAIFKMAAKTRHKNGDVKIQHCPISSKFYMWVDSVSGRYGRLHSR